MLQNPLTQAAFQVSLAIAEAIVQRRSFTLLKWSNGDQRRDVRTGEIVG